MLMRRTILFNEQLLYSRAIHTGMYCTFPKQMVVISIKNILWEAKAVLSIKLAFLLIFVTFSVITARQENCGISCLTTFSFYSEEKCSGWSVLFAVFAHLFGRNIAETSASCLKSATDVIPILFQLKIFVAVFILVHAFSTFLLISIYLFSLAYNKRVIRIHSNTWTWLKSSIPKPLLGAIEKRQNKANTVWLKYSPL